MKKVLLWQSDYGYETEPATLIDPDELIENVNLFEQHVFMFTKLESTEQNEKWLNSLLPKLNETYCNYYDITDIPELEGVETEQAEDSEIAKHVLCYFAESENIGYLDECETTMVYGYHDGSNWKEIWCDENTTETEVEIDDENSENLDEWDGNNWSYNGRFNHGIKYPVITIDGKIVEGKFLIEEWSQYQGSLPTGEIVEE